MTVGLYADRVELPEAIFRREPYLVALVASGTTKGEIEVKSQIFKGIHRKRPLFLNGFELYPVGDTGGFLTARIVVMESDAGFRRLGRLIEKGREQIREIPSGARLAQGVADIGIAGVSVGEALDKVVEVLKGNADDEMLTTDVRFKFESGKWFLENQDEPDWDPLEFGPDGSFSFVRTSEKARLTLRFATSREAGLEVGLEEVGFAPPKSWRKIARGCAVRVIYEGRVHVGTYLGRRGRGGLLLARPVDGGNAVEIEVGSTKDFLVRLADFDVDYAAFLRRVLLGDRPETVHIGRWAFSILLAVRPDIAAVIGGDVDFDPSDDGSMLPEFLGRVAHLWMTTEPGADDDDE